jgi:hypothetical protein
MIESVFGEHSCAATLVIPSGEHKVVAIPGMYHDKNLPEEHSHGDSVAY